MESLPILKTKWHIKEAWGQEWKTKEGIRSGIVPLGS